MNKRQNRLADVPPLILDVSRWLVEQDEEAKLTFEVTPALGGGDFTLRWGDGPRQQRTYLLQEVDLTELLDWLITVLRVDMG
jgi:hypothetical protein